MVSDVEFEVFVLSVEPRLRRALLGAVGINHLDDAVGEALAFSRSSIGTGSLGWRTRSATCFGWVNHTPGHARRRGCSVTSLCRFPTSSHASSSCS